MEDNEPTTDENPSIQASDKELLVPTEEVKIRKFPITIEPIIMGLFLVDGLGDAITTNLIVSRTCQIHFGFNKSVCEALANENVNDSDIEALVQPYVDVIITSMNFLSVFIPAVFSLFLGSWSDYNGRKLLLILPAVGYFLKFVSLGVFSYFGSLGPSWALLCVLPVSLTGGMVTFVFVSYTYVSDITEESKRSFRIVVAESAMIGGSLIGLLSAAPVFNAGGQYGYILVYGLAAGVILLVTVPTCFLLRDSVQRSESGEGIFHVFETRFLREMLQVCFKKREDSKRAVIFLTIISLTIIISIMMGEGNVIYLFVRLRFGWKVDKFTLWTSIVLAVCFFGAFVGILLFEKYLKIPHSIICAISCTLKCASTLYVAFLPTDKPELMYFVGLINFFGGLQGPVARTMLSKTVPKEDLSKVFSFLSSSEAIFPLGIGPLYTVIYNSTINVLPSAFLLVSSLLMFICSVFFVVIYFIQRSADRRKYDQLENETG